MIRMKRVQPGERIPIRLTDHERKLILDHTFIGGDLVRRIRVVAADGPAVVMPSTWTILRSFSATSPRRQTTPRTRASQSI